MKATELRTTLIQQRIDNSEEVPDHSEETVRWKNVRKLRAKITASGGGAETFLQNQMKAILTYDVIIRFTADISPEDRLVDETQGKKYEIITVHPLEQRGHWMKLRVQEWQLQHTSA